jgi:mRNA-degrading endonuclease RelE of RelBE toxin-antitoxin system
MNVEYSRQFVKAALLLTGKYKELLQRIVMEVKQSDNLREIRYCVRMAGFRNAYRMKMGITGWYFRKAGKPGRI